MCYVYTPALEIIPWPPQLTPLPFTLQDPFFFLEHNSSRCSVGVLHLSGNSAQELSTFAHTVITAWDTYPPPPPQPYSSPHHSYPRSSVYSLDLTHPSQTASSPGSRLAVSGFLCIYFSQQGLHFIVMTCLLLCVTLDCVPCTGVNSVLLPRIYLQG